MKRILIKIIVPVAALGAFVVASTIAWSNNAPAPRGQVSSTIVDFDQVFAEVTDATRREGTPPVLTEINFHQAFADASVRPDRENTPTNREKLRDVGWTRIIGSR